MLLLRHVAIYVLPEYLTSHAHHVSHTTTVYVLSYWPGVYALLDWSHMETSCTIRLGRGLENVRLVGAYLC